MLQISKSCPCYKCMKRSTLGVRRSKLSSHMRPKFWMPGGGIILYPLVDQVFYFVMSLNCDKYSSFVLLVSLCIFLLWLMLRIKMNMDDYVTANKTKLFYQYCVYTVCIIYKFHSRSALRQGLFCMPRCLRTHVSSVQSS